MPRLLFMLRCLRLCAACCLLRLHTLIRVDYCCRRRFHYFYAMLAPDTIRHADYLRHFRGCHFHANIFTLRQSATLMFSATYVITPPRCHAFMPLRLLMLRDDYTLLMPPVYAAAAAAAIDAAMLLMP